MHKTLDSFSQTRYYSQWRNLHDDTSEGFQLLLKVQSGYVFWGHIHNILRTISKQLACTVYTAEWDEGWNLYFNIYQSLSPGQHYQWHQEYLLLSQVLPQQHISERQYTHPVRTATYMGLSRTTQQDTGRSGKCLTVSACYLVQ